MDQRDKFRYKRRFSHFIPKYQLKNIITLNLNLNAEAKKPSWCLLDTLKIKQLKTFSSSDEKKYYYIYSLSRLEDLDPQRKELNHHSTQDWYFAL
jgi:hypothetical protein